MVSKKEIRKYIFAQRKEISIEEVEKNSRLICDTVTSLPEFLAAECVYAYADYNKEVSTRGIIEEAWKAGKRVAVPKVTGAHEMKYYYITSFDQLSPGYFQIPEPEEGAEAQEENAFLIVPGVAFDKNRHRAGYGQGFYDRYLSMHPKHKTAAIAFEFQIVEEIPAEATDIFPDKVVTEKRVIEWRKSKTVVNRWDRQSCRFPVTASSPS